MSVFKELLARHVGSAFSRQIAFAELLGERSCSLDLGAGRVRFGADLAYPIQLLGRESDGDRCWRWAWAEPTLAVHAEWLVASEKLRALGEREGITELCQPMFSQRIADGHSLALLASGLEQSGSCYYCGKQADGALFFLVDKALPVVAPPLPQAAVVSLIGQLVEQFNLKHRMMLEGFLVDQGFALRVQGHRLLASRQGDDLSLRFDPMGRLLELEAPRAPAPTPASRPWWKFWE